MHLARATMAQLVERVLGKDEVASSILASSSISCLTADTFLSVVFFFALLNLILVNIFHI